MPLTIGSRLGPYEIQSAIGAGGMGEVFRARDVRLGRDVAVKVVPEPFAHDPDRVARFAREAQVLASLNHPNIAAIYGFEESASVKALVLELVEGPTLADRIADGPIPVDEALAIAKQIVDALQAAHDQGVIHRDLKPANIKLRADGTVKVLDFGLAKALDWTSTPGADAMNSPTLTARATALGMILGTAAYMAPEQAKGKAVDKRADIWAFGCVLYEMLAGRRAFAGEDVSDTLAFVITREPEWTALPAVLPRPIRKLLRRCLEKERKRRLADISDARLEIEEAEAASTDFDRAVGPGTPGRRSLRALPWVVAIILAASLAGVLALWAPWRGEPSRTALRLSAELGADLVLQPGAGFAPAMALSPDGKLLAFTATAPQGRRLLFMRHLDQLQAVPLAGTDEAGNPFFSPDGRSIAFFADGKLKRMPVAGGPAVALADAPDPRGGSWVEDDTIVFTPDRRGARILRMASAHSDISPLTAPEAVEPGDLVQRWPQVLPDGQAVLYTSHSRPGDFENASIVVRQLSGGARRIVLRGGYHGRFVPSGHLLYIRDRTLFAVRFDLGRLETSGTATPVVEGVISSTLSGGAQFAVSNAGTLAYLTGEGFSSAPLMSWLGPGGKLTPLRSMSGVWESLDMSPNGQRIAVDVHDGKQWDIWMYELARDRMSRVTFESATKPVWTPDGVRIVFSHRYPQGGASLAWRRADGAGAVQQLTTAAYPQRAASWHPSGRFLAFVELNPVTNWDVMILPIEGNETSGWKPGTPFAFLDNESGEAEPSFSPDGKWLAYHSNESGRDEVYVRPFPGPGARTPISSDGGSQPIWSPKGNLLYYMAGEGQLMVVTYTVEAGTFTAEKPRLWSQGRFVGRPGFSMSRSIDVHPDGDRFIVAALTDEQKDVTRDHVVLIFNFFDELNRIAPRPVR